MDMEIGLDNVQPTYGPSVSEGSSGQSVDFSKLNIDLNVEFDVNDWKGISPTHMMKINRIAIVDGVEQVDSDLWLEQDGLSLAPALLGTFVIGYIDIEVKYINVETKELRVTPRNPYSLRGNTNSFSKPKIERILLTPHHLPTQTYDVRLSRTRLAYKVIVPEKESDLRSHFSSLRTEKEWEMAVDLSNSGNYDIVLLDGRLTGLVSKPLQAPIVGYVKTLRSKRLFEIFTKNPNAVKMLSILEEGQRTPIFVMQYLTKGMVVPVSRYACLVRVKNVPRGYSRISNVVRLELDATHYTLAQAQEIFDTLTIILQSISGPVNGNPRAPQQLPVVNQLEHFLRKFLVETRIIRSHILNSSNHTPGLRALA